jgi:hypothetical protein
MSKEKETLMGLMRKKTNQKKYRWKTRIRNHSTQKDQKNVRIKSLG